MAALAGFHTGVTWTGTLEESRIGLTDLTRTWRWADLSSSPGCSSIAPATCESLVGVVLQSALRHPTHLRKRHVCPARLVADVGRLRPG